LELLDIEEANLHKSSALYSYYLIYLKHFLQYLKAIILEYYALKNVDLYGFLSLNIALLNNSDFHFDQLL